MTEAGLPDDAVDEVVAREAAASDRDDAEHRAGNGAGPEPGAPDAAGPEADPDRGVATPEKTDDVPPEELSVETLITDLEATTKQRDEYLDHVRRVQADFENFRKRAVKQQADAGERAAATVAEALLPVLDACDSAMQHGSSEVEPIFASLLAALEKQGLERIDPAGEPFDPNHHEAVVHEPAGDGEGEEQAPPTVSDVMRPGYAWAGRVLRPAMVKVRG